MKYFFFILLISLNIWAKPARQVLQLMTSESPPFMAEKMAQQGAAIYALQKLFQSAGFDIEMTFSPWTRAKIFASENLKIDGFFPYAERGTDDEFIYSKIIYESPWVIVQRKDHKITYKKNSDLADHLIAGNVTGVELRPGIKELADQKKLTVDTVLTDSINLLRLGIKRVDFVMMDPIVYRYNMQTEPKLAPYKDQFEINPKAIAVTRYGLALRNTAENKKILEQFNQIVTIKKMHKHIDYYLKHVIKK